MAHGPPTDLLWKSQSSWGAGSDVVTSLVNSDGEVTLPLTGRRTNWAGGRAAARLSPPVACVLQEVARRSVSKKVQVENGEEEEEEEDDGEEPVIHKKVSPHFFIWDYWDGAVWTPTKLGIEGWCHGCEMRTCTPSDMGRAWHQNSSVHNGFCVN